MMVAYGNVTRGIGEMRKGKLAQEQPRKGSSRGKLREWQDNNRRGKVRMI